MKLLLDTCALIWYLAEDSRLLPEVYEQIADSDNEVFVSATSAWEIEIKSSSPKSCESDGLRPTVGDRNVRLIPDVLVGGSNGSTNGLVDGLLSMILWNQTNKTGEVTPPTIAKTPPVSQNGNSQLLVELPKDK